MPINFLEWIKLSDAMQLAYDVFGDWQIAGRAITYNLETSGVRAISEEFLFRGLDYDSGNGEDTELSNWRCFKWSEIAAHFWPGALIDWGANFASVTHTNVDFRASGVMVHKVTIQRILSASGDATDQATQTSKGTIKKWSRKIEEDLQERAIKIADGHLTTEEVWHRLNDEIAPTHVGIVKFRARIWPAVPNGKKRGSGGNAATISAR